MSQLSEALEPHLPEGFPVPDALERAWSWMESQGYQGRSGDRAVLLPFGAAGTGAVAFGLGPSAADFLGPGVDTTRVVPIGSLSFSGNVMALWQEQPGDEPRFVVLGSEGETFLLATDAVQFCRLLAIGYPDISSDWVLNGQPEDPDPAQTLAPLRQWVETELGVTVPEHWEVADPDPFQAWVKAQRPTPAERGPEPGYHRIDLSVAQVLDLAEELALQQPPASIGGLDRDGLTGTAGPFGFEFAVMSRRPGFDDDRDTPVAEELAQQISRAATQRWGTGRERLPTTFADGGSFIDQKIDANEVPGATVWDISSDRVFGLVADPDWGDVEVLIMTRPAAEQPWE